MIRVERGVSTAQGTPGSMVIGDKRWPVIELPWRGNKPNISCVQAGVYMAQLDQSAVFGDCVRLFEIPDRWGVLFHSGNWAGDVALNWKTHSKGCPLPGMRVGKLAFKGKAQRAVLGSRTAMREIIAKIKDNLPHPNARFKVEFVWVSG